MEYFKLRDGNKLPVIALGPGAVVIIVSHWHAVGLAGLQTEIPTGIHLVTKDES